MKRHKIYSLCRFSQKLAGTPFNARCYRRFGGIYAGWL
ncbi:Uncharacterised protein [Pantoea agglomerans]|uniref:Uncharacterized protein n=1 Tax=Enterobacter agglomerans TaxID=549 RepID=A0A379ACN9_ENTAG|nr:Uncharacterised protein [Pantoea agglomerans]